MKRKEINTSEKTNKKRLKYKLIITILILLIINGYLLFCLTNNEWNKATFFLVLNIVYIQIIREEII